MRILVMVVICFGAQVFEIRAQFISRAQQVAQQAQRAAAAQSVADQQSQAESDRAQQNAAFAARVLASVNRDPWRDINGVTCRVTSKWPTFAAERVLEVGKDWIRVQGYCDEIGADVLNGGAEFFVLHFPYDLAEGDSIPVGPMYRAQVASKVSYETVLGGSRTLRALDYGTVVGPPPEVAERAQEAQKQAQMKAAAAKVQAAMAALKFWREKAEAGEANGEYQLGLIYLEGRGVAADPRVAREWFAKASAQGSQDAAVTLKKLPPN